MPPLANPRHAGGMHVLADFFGIICIHPPQAIEELLSKAAEVAGATVLHRFSHRFEPAGITAAVMLAESHITIHTWPEQKFAAIDIFMCGACDPHAALAWIQQSMRPERVDISTHQRGPSQDNSANLTPHP